MLDLTAAARGRTARSSTASTCSCSIRTSASTRPTTTSSGSPTRSARRTSSSARSSRRSGRRPAAARRWAATTSGRAFVTQVRKACASARSCATSASAATASSASTRPRARRDWAKDPAGNTKKIAETFRQAADIAEDHGERLAAEGEICWGGMHSVKRNVELLEMVDRPQTVGFQADMAHTLLFTMGYNAPEDRILPGELRLDGPEALDEALKKMTRALRPWTIDFHVAQNDAHGQGLRLARQDRPPLPAARSQRQARHRRSTPATGCATTTASSTRKFQHICWDGCMFPNDVMMQQQTWNDILGVMVGGARRARVGLISSIYVTRMPMKTSEHRSGRLRLHGADALECVPAGAALLRPAAAAGAEGGGGAQRRARQGVRGQLGLRVGTRPTGASWSSARTSTSSTSPARTTRITRSPSRRRRPARW